MLYCDEEEDEVPENPKIYSFKLQHTGTLTVAVLLDYLGYAAPAAIKGIARPAHYFQVVILDEIFRQRAPTAKDDGPANRLEDLTHKMCYLFRQATKAVSVCPPAYYANLVCERAQCYLSTQ